MTFLLFVKGEESLKGKLLKHCYHRENSQPTFSTIANILLAKKSGVGEIATLLGLNISVFIFIG
jgi:hypothetical protein